MKNTSGIEPIGDIVLVKLDEVEEKVGSVLLPEDYRDRKQVAATTGTIISLGSDAFLDFTDMRKPQVGDRIVFKRYAGSQAEGVDVENYYLMKAKDVFGVYRPVAIEAAA